MKTYQECLYWLYSQLPMFQKEGKSAYHPGLDNIKLLLKELGHPERLFDTIHVAGTNGKGSVSHMLASVCQEAGMKVGLYTSPHLKYFEERVRINGVPVSKQKVIEFTKKISIALKYLKILGAKSLKINNNIATETTLAIMKFLMVMSL